MLLSARSKVLVVALASAQHVAWAAATENIADSAKPEQLLTSRWWDTLAPEGFAKAEHLPSLAEIVERTRQLGKIVYAGFGSAGSKIENTADSMSDLSLANSVYEKIASEMQRMAELTQDAASAASKRSIDASMQRLHEAIAKAGDSAPRWPAASPDVANDDQAVARYISELNQAVQYAHSQLFGQIELCSEAVGSIGRSRSTIQLPLAGGFGPMIAALLIYLICDVWRRKAELRRRERMRAAADKAGAVASGAFQQECSLVSDVITTSCAYLVVLPITTILLMIMEINGAAGWLISSSYICLLCATLIAAQPSFLASIWSRQDLVDVGQRLAVGIMTIASFCCAIHALKADASTSAMA